MRRFGVVREFVVDCDVVGVGHGLLFVVGLVSWGRYGEI